MSLFLDDSILPPEPPGALPILHDREYRVRAFRLAADRILVQGAIRDQKPPGLYLFDDPDPLTVHHMQLSIEISFPQLVIEAVRTHFESHPDDTCPTITDHYGHLIGLSIARGFTHRVRDLFGGPRGCTHVTALLQAMAPVALQCFWSMRAVGAKLAGDREPILGPPGDDDSWRVIVDTCHVWAEGGPTVEAQRNGTARGVPVFLRRRLADLGITPGGGAGDVES